MLSDIFIQEPVSANQCIAPSHPQGISDRWTRNLEEDVKEAISLLFKFKAQLDKLHPRAAGIIEQLLANNRSY